MQESIVTTVLFPLALAVVMLGLGLSLTVADFTRVGKHPRAVFVALACQVVLLPLICLGLVTVTGLEPALAVGMMLLAASPGGTVANLYSHLAGGDVALNITLTAVNSVLSAFTLPIVVNLSLTHFMGDGEDIGLQTGKVVQVFAVVLVPVAIGMLLRRLRPAFAESMRKPVRAASAIIVIGVIVAAIVQERHQVLDALADVGLVAAAFSVISLLAGYWIPRLARVERRQAIASAMEIGIHNSALAITIAISPALLANPRMSIAPAIYALLSFFITAAFGYLLSRAAARPGSPLPAP
ncbi:bile acid:sodium symporter family protein [Bailinhaonella thermotolerans]|uniref:Bile acid:sodium symporter family protein n=1 Tax=Bailinhaonella thermotolerans TaxID=1070861 RepID=A0A3A4A8Z3_9ACTN|nr:bile acid:sodium symporter family protein [Bailinhaonella thermotolerans]RJL21722.1 bile acid:sodium symporter family protein [Bailinhaonella thermotolerans]